LPLIEPTAALNDSQTLNAITPLLNLGSLTVLEENIHRAVKDVDDSYTPDCDGIPAYLLKHCIEVLCVPLKILFDKSLSRGHFADRWKVASVTPILNSGPRNNIENYRPIAKISSIAKLFERIVAHKLSFLVKTYISTSQHGFVAGRSTTSNLVVFSNYCIHAFDMRSQVDAIYTDFAKAFDKVCHSALLAKLARLGIHSTLLNWIKSYLHHRLYRVNINGKFSDSYLATSGLPQGRAMGPLLFIIFINGVRFCLSSECLLYAGDLKICKSIQLATDSQLIQHDLDSLSSWCSPNSLPLNISKCFYVTYSKSVYNFVTSYNINGQLRQESLDLGVLFDSKFKFAAHFDYIMPRAYAMFGFVKRNASLSLHQTCALFCICPWNPFTTTHGNRIERLQKQFLKFALLPLRFLDPTPSYHQQCRLVHLPSLEHRRSILAICFISDLVDGSIVCPELLSKVGFHAPSRQLRNFDPFFLELRRTNYFKNEPLHKALYKSNALPIDMQLDYFSSKSILKHRLVIIL